MNYKEILFEDDVMDVVNKLAIAGINIVAISVDADHNRIVVDTRDLSRTLPLISGSICVSNVMLYNIQDHPGSLREILQSLSGDSRTITELYAAEDNRIVIRYQGLCL